MRCTTRFTTITSRIRTQAIIRSCAKTARRIIRRTHAQVVDAEIVFNTVVNPGRQVLIGHDSTNPLPVTNSVFANNIISGTGTLYSESGGSGTPVNLTRSQNIANRADQEIGFHYRESFAHLAVVKMDSACKKLSSGSPAIRAAKTPVFTLTYVTDDMDGQSRSSPDIGADEFSTGSISRTPLKTTDVGPASGGGIGGGGSFHRHL